MKKNNFLELSISLVISAIIISTGIYFTKKDKNYVKVVGYSVESFEADLIRWSFNISETTDLSYLKEGYTSLNKKLNQVKALIQNEKLDSLELLVKPVNINDIYDRNGITSGKKLSQEIVITSKSIKRLEDISTNPTLFIDRNILFEFSNIEFYSTNLDQIKKQLLGKAVINAKERANEILTAVNKTVGDLKSARSGVFQITEPLSTEVAGYGIHSTSTKKKNIKVTVSAEFEID